MKLDKRFFVSAFGCLGLLLGGLRLYSTKPSTSHQLVSEQLSEKGAMILSATQPPGQRLKFMPAGITSDKVPKISSGDEETPGPLDAKVDLILPEFYKIVTEHELKSARLIANYVERDMEVAAVEFNGLDEEHLHLIRTDLVRRIAAAFSSSDQPKAQKLAREKLLKFAASELIHQGFTIICPVSGEGKVRYSLVKSAQPHPLKLEEGRVIESISNGSFRFLNEKQAMRYSHLLGTKEIP